MLFDSWYFFIVQFMGHSDKLYDLDALFDIYQEESSVKRSISVLLKSFPKYIENFEKAYNAQDWNAFYRASHKLLTPMRIFNVTNIVEDMVEIELNTRNGSYFTRVDDLYIKVLPALKELYQQLLEYVEE